MFKLETLIVNLTLSLIRFPKSCLLIIFVIAAILMSQLKLLTFDASTEGFLNKESIERQEYMAFEKKYGLSAYIIILLKDQNLFSAASITELRNIEKEIREQVPHIETIESIANTRFISSVDDDITIDELFPQDLSQVDFVEKKQFATTTPYYLNRIVNVRGDVTAISLKFVQQVRDKKTGQMRQIFLPEVQESLDSLRKVVDQHQPFYNNTILIGGTPTVTAELTSATKHDLILFSLLAIAVVGTVLFFMFRRVTAIILPLTCLMLTVFITLSLMAIFRFPMQVTSSILPSFLLAVCIGDAVHFLKTFYVHLNKGLAKYDAISESIRHCAEPMFYTTLTTAVGLGSFVTSDLNYVVSFGLFSFFGVWLAFFLTIILIPCSIMILPMHAKEEKTIHFSPNQINMLDRFIYIISRNYFKILILSSLLLISSVYLASGLKFSHNPIMWFPKDNPVKLASEEIEKELAGTMQAELLIHNKGNHDQPLTLVQMQALDKWLDYVESSTFAGVKVTSSVSILNLIKEVNHVLNLEQGYSMPDNQELLAQELLLIQLNDTNLVNSFSNDDQSELRISLSIPWQDSLVYSQFIEELNASFNQSLGENLDIKMTGMATVANTMFSTFIKSMGQNFTLAGIVILTTMIFLFRYIKLGLAMALPNTLPIFLVLALMYVFNIPLDLFTLLIGNIAVGLVVDDTIHLTYAFQQYFEKTKNVSLALQEAFKSSGISLIVTTVVLSSGFLIYTASSLNNLTNFGLLTALCLVFALIADFIITPAILFMIYSKYETATAKI